MPISVSCKCGKKFKAPDKLAGKRVKCPACTEPLQIPQATSQAQPTPESSSKAIKVGCSCGKNLMVKAELEGKSIRCPHCGASVLVKAKSETAASSRGSARAAEKGALGELLDEVDLGVSATGHRCPECRNDLEPDDIICVKCGYNLESGKKLETKTSRKRDPLTGLAPPSATEKKRGRKTKGVKSGADPELRLVLGAAGLIIVPPLGLWFIAPLVAMMWFAAANTAISLVVYLYVVVGAFREDGVLHGLGTLICGIYWIVYAFMHLDRTKTALIIWGITVVCAVVNQLFLQTALMESLEGR